MTRLIGDDYLFNFCYKVMKLCGLKDILIFCLVVKSAQVKPSSDGEPSLAKRQKLEDSALRKSQRHRKQRGEKEVRISSAMTLKEFKIKVKSKKGERS